MKSNWRQRGLMLVFTGVVFGLLSGALTRDLWGNSSVEYTAPASGGGGSTSLSIEQGGNPFASGINTVNYVGEELSRSGATLTVTSKVSASSPLTGDGSAGSPLDLTIAANQPLTDSSGLSVTYDGRPFTLNGSNELALRLDYSLRLANGVAMNLPIGDALTPTVKFSETDWLLFDGFTLSRSGYQTTISQNVSVASGSLLFGDGNGNSSPLDLTVTTNHIIGNDSVGTQAEALRVGIAAGYYTGHKIRGGTFELDGLVQHGGNDFANYRVLNLVGFEPTRSGDTLTITNKVSVTGGGITGDGSEASPLNVAAAGTSLTIQQGGNAFASGIDTVNYVGEELTRSGSVLTVTSKVSASSGITGDGSAASPLVPPLLANGIATQVAGTSTAPQVNVDSGALTPTYGLLQGGLVAGISTQVGGTSNAPKIDVDSANLSPSYSRLQGGLVDGLSTQVAGTSNAPQINVDSANLSPTYGRLQGGLVAGLSTQVGGTSNAVAINVDSSTITPTMGNVQGFTVASPLTGAGTSGSPLDITIGTGLTDSSGIKLNMVWQDKGAGSTAADTGNVSSVMASASHSGGVVTVNITPTTYLSAGVPFAQADHVNFGSGITAVRDSAGIVSVSASSTGATAASETEMEDADPGDGDEGLNTVFATPANLKWHPGVAKAWVTFSAAGTISEDYNVSSITDNGTGDWSIVIDQDAASAGYAAVGTCRPVNAFNTEGYIVCFNTAATTGLDLELYDGASGTVPLKEDPASGGILSAAIFGAR